MGRMGLMRHKGLMGEEFSRSFCLGLHEESGKRRRRHYAATAINALCFVRSKYPNIGIILPTQMTCVTTVPNFSDMCAEPKRLVGCYERAVSRRKQSEEKKITHGGPRRLVRTQRAIRQNELGQLCQLFLRIWWASRSRLRGPQVVAHRLPKFIELETTMINPTA